MLNPHTNAQVELHNAEISQTRTGLTTPSYVAYNHALRKEFSNLTWNYNVYLRHVLQNVWLPP